VNHQKNNLQGAPEGVNDNATARGPAATRLDYGRGGRIHRHGVQTRERPPKADRCDPWGEEKTGKKKPGQLLAGNKGKSALARTRATCSRVVCSATTIRAWESHLARKKNLPR